MTNSKRSLLNDLPQEIVADIISLLELSDRARVEATSKSLWRLSKSVKGKLCLDIRKRIDARGSFVWLNATARHGLQSVDDLTIFVCKRAYIKPPSLSSASIDWKFFGHHLTGLHLADRKRPAADLCVTSDAIRALHPLTNLQCLETPYEPISSLRTVPLSEFSVFSKLRRLRLFSAKVESSKYTLECAPALTGLSELKHLSVGSLFTMRANETFRKIAAELTYLSLQFIDDDNDDGPAIVIPKMIQLEFAEYYHTKAFDINSSPSLAILAWEKDVSPADEIESLSHLSNLRDLELRLILEENEDPQITCTLQQFHNLTCLTKLKLQGIISASQYLLQPYTSLPRLEELALMTLSFQHSVSSLLPIGDCMPELKTLKVIPVLKSKDYFLEVDFKQLPELQDIEVEGVVVMNSPTSVSLKRLTIQSLKGCSYIQSVFAGFMRGLPLLKHLHLQLLVQEGNEAQWLTASFKNMKAVKSLVLQFSSPQRKYCKCGELRTNAAEETQAFVDAVLPKLETLTSLQSLELDCPDSFLRLKRSWIPGVLSLGLRSSKLSMCISCMAVSCLALQYGPSHGHLSDTTLQLMKTRGDMRVNLAKLVSFHEGQCVQACKMTNQRHPWIPHIKELKDVVRESDD